MLEPSVEAVRLLGRWTRVSQLHAQGCACCGGGFGNVSMRTVERSLLAWLRESHPLLGEPQDLAALLRECVERRSALPPAGLVSLLDDLGRAIGHLERIQGFAP